MKKTTVQDIARMCGGKLEGDGERSVSSVSINSKEITPGALFVPFKGSKVDGHDFISDAAENDAAAALCARPDIALRHTPLVRVRDTGEALFNLGKNYRKRMRARIVGITGSVGKTTVKEMTAAVLGTRFNVLKTEGNYNNHIGLPLTLLRLDETHDAAVVEMGMSDFGEIRNLTRAALPEVAMITNIGVSHIEKLGSKAGILSAKLEILEGLPEDGLLIINGDDPLLWEARAQAVHKAVTCGIKNKACDLYAENLCRRADGTAFEICLKNKRFEAKTASFGEHNVLNAVMAAACGVYFGLSEEDITSGLLNYAPPPMRQEIYEAKGYIILEDCYNASPDSMIAAFKVLSELPAAGRKIAVLGGIRELGSHHEGIHVDCGRAAARYADALYLLGEEARFYRKGALLEGMNEGEIHLFETREALAEALAEDMQKGDALLFKGSRLTKMEEILGLFLAKDV